MRKAIKVTYHSDTENQCVPKKCSVLGPILSGVTQSILQVLSNLCFSSEYEQEFYV